MSKHIALVVHVARNFINQRIAEAYGVDAEDQWKTHGEGFLEDAIEMLEAAGVPELLEVLGKAKELLDEATEIDFDDMAHIVISSEDSCAMRGLIEKVLNGDCMPNETSKNSTPPPPPAPQPPRQIREGMGIVKPRQPLRQSEGASMNDKEHMTDLEVQQRLHAEVVELGKKALQWEERCHALELALEANRSAAYIYAKQVGYWIGKHNEVKGSLDFYKRRADALQEWQSKMRDPERTINE